jgi:hypothetical protein
VELDVDAAQTLDVGLHDAIDLVEGRRNLARHHAHLAALGRNHVRHGHLRDAGQAILQALDRAGAGAERVVVLQRTGQ